MLDIFTAGGATAGRVNINSKVQPQFYPPGGGVRRSVPLLALLSSVLGSGGSAVANQIYDDSNRVDNYGMNANGSQNGVFDIDRRAVRGAPDGQRGEARPARKR